MIKKIILWYVLRIHHGEFKHKGKVIRAFTEEWYNEYIKGIDVVKVREALKKQDSEKPLGGRDIDGNEYMICKECCAIVADGEWVAHYCPDCGQKVDWGEENG